MKTKLDLLTANKMADQWALKLLPYCNRIVVAGSIRRRCEVVGDIDFVCVPKLVPILDLTESVIGFRNLVHEYIDSTIAADPGLVWIRGGDAPGDLCTFEIRDHSGKSKIAVDIYFTDDAHWGANLLSRTGPKEHNIWLASRATARGKKLSPTRGLQIASYSEVADSEEATTRPLGWNGFAPRSAISSI